MKKLKLVTILQSLIITALILFIAGLLLLRKEHKEQSIPVSLSSDGDEYENENTYETTGQKILLSDSDYGEIWIPVLADVPACEYQAEQYVTRNNQTYYTENNHIVSQFGVDISSHQEEIDWQTVKKSGVDFAMIRLGYRGYSGGKLFMDEYFEQNVQGAQEAGIDIGLYFYSQAITPEEAEEEADMVLSVLAGRDDIHLTYPVVYDWETVTTDVARTDNISVETLTECSIAFCEKIKQAGYIPMIYQNKSTSLLKLYLPELTDYDFWLAEYKDKATYYYNYQMWQYASDGTVPGITGDVDVNVCFKDYTNSENKESDAYA